ncbi:MAG TPA: chromate transporter [Stellaceae bacterium]|nr:chromate transporter [Stellaceae bacterium]
MTDDSRTLAALVVIFAPLSLVSVGGGPAIFAEMQRQAVTIHGWMTAREFSDLFAISRAAPGPGALLATLIGWKAASWPGALVVSLAFFLPSSIMAYAAARLWNRGRGSRWHSAVEAGFAPIATGLVLAGAFAILSTEGRAILAWTIAFVVAAMRLWRPTIHPLLLLGFGAAVFLLAHHLG